ncbi:MAG: hypothetical protein KDA32_00080 [Phycisphaerales bacterium]|nr:hypothetical protein [Phycisphaerales bacterium]
MNLKLWISAIVMTAILGCAQRHDESVSTTPPPETTHRADPGPPPTRGMGEMALLPDDGSGTVAQRSEASPRGDAPRPPAQSSSSQSTASESEAASTGVTTTSAPTVVEAVGDAITLKPRYEEGAVDYFETNQTLERELVRGDDATRSKITQIIGVQRQVLSVDEDGGAQMELTFHRFGRIDDTGRSPLDYDTDRDDYGHAPTPLGQSLRTLIGSNFKLTVDGEGDATEQLGLANLRDRVTSAADQPTRLAIMTELSDERVFYRWGTSIYALCSPEPVRVGDSWTRTVLQEDPTTGSRTNYYYNKLERIEEENGHRVAIISFTGEIKQDQPGLFSLVSGTFEGTAAFDIDLGRFVRKTTEADMRWRIGTAPADGTEDGAIRVMNRAQETVRIMSPAERSAEYQRLHGK